MFMSSHPAKAGGVQEHILFLSQELRALGHTVTIFGPTPKKNIYSHYHVMGEKIYLQILGDNEANIHTLFAKDKPEKIFTHKNFDILHIHEPYMPVAAWSVLEKSSIPVVGTFHTAWDNDSLLKILNIFMPLFKDRFSQLNHSAIFVSNVTKKTWEYLCSPSMLKATIPNAVDITSFYPKDGLNKKIELLYVARLVARKGIDKLLEAVLQLVEKKVDFHLTIIGGGYKAGYVKQFIKDHKLKNTVSYLGEIKGTRRLTYFRNADIFCAPYINEAASISILEAVSCGLPVIGFKTPIFTDLLSNYPAQELLTKKSINHLAKALEETMQNRQYLLKIKRWCIQQRKRFSWRTVALKTEKVYYKTIQAYS